MCQRLSEKPRRYTAETMPVRRVGNRTPRCRIYGKFTSPAAGRCRDMFLVEGGLWEHA